MRRTGHARAAVVAVAALLLGAVRPARAERDTAIGIDNGFASAVGIFGVTLTRAVGDNFRLEAGTGIGATGFQLSLMPQFVTGEGRNHFVAGAGVAVALPINDHTTEGHPIWLNLDALGYEHRFASGFSVSFALGITIGLGGGRYCRFSFDSDGVCDRPADKENVRGLWTPQGRFQLAYWF